MHRLSEVQLHFLFFITCTALFFFSGGCDSKPEEQGEEKAPSTNISIKDKPIADFESELLDLAFESVTAMPAELHIKDRSRAQQKVFKSCLELDQPKRALSYLKQIVNWRRNLCYAELGLYFAEKGKTKEAQHFIQLASDSPPVVDPVLNQEWHLNRIKSKMIEGYIELGSAKKANTITEGIDEEDKEFEVFQEKKKFRDEDTFDEQIKVLNQMIERADLDMAKAALKSYTKLYKDVYSNEEQREIVAENVKSSWEGVPLTIRIDVLTKMAEHALEHSDKETALQLVNYAQSFMNESKWPTDIYLVKLGQLIEVRFKAGDIEEAKSDANKGLELFESKRRMISGLHRAGALRPLAEAYQAMGQTEKALSVYKRAIEEGVVNPNSRPRAEDLAATCCSMALRGLEPDAELWERIRRIREELGHPW